MAARNDSVRYHILHCCAEKDIYEHFFPFPPTREDNDRCLVGVFGGLFSGIFLGFQFSCRSSAQANLELLKCLRAICVLLHRTTINMLAIVILKQAQMASCPHRGQRFKHLNKKGIKIISKYRRG